MEVFAHVLCVQPNLSLHLLPLLSRTDIVHENCSYLMQVFAGGEGGSAETQHHPGLAQAVRVWIVIGLSDQLAKDFIPQLDAFNAGTHNVLQR